MTAEKKVCPECRVSIKEANYEKHLSRVHGKTLEEVEGPRPRDPSGSKAKVLAIAVIVIIIVSLFAYYMVFTEETPIEIITTDDTDGDGMPDSFEIANNLNPSDDWDAAQDFDKDGETNLAEYTAGTNPRSTVTATITIAGYSDPVVITLRPDVAPITVKNFLDYIEADFYSGLIFHRVIDAFMVQGGGFNPDMTQKTPNAPITLEPTTQTGLLHEDGAISMARTNDPNSGTSQFFICDGPQSFLDGSSTSPGYAVFGKVSSGMSTVRAISTVPTGTSGGHSDVPVTPVIISSVTAAWTD